MREFMHKSRKLLGLRLSRQDIDAASVACAEGRTNVLGKNKLDSLLLDKGEKAVAILARIPAHLAQDWKLRAFGLRDIKDVRIAKANENAGVLASNVLFGLLVLLTLDADDGSENADTLLSLLHLAA